MLYNFVHVYKNINFIKFFQKPLHFAGVFGIIIRRLRFLYFGKAGCDMRRGERLPLRWVFSLSMSGLEPGEKIRTAKG